MFRGSRGKCRLPLQKWAYLEAEAEIDALSWTLYINDGITEINAGYHGGAKCVFCRGHGKCRRRQDRVWKHSSIRDVIDQRVQLLVNMAAVVDDIEHRA